MSGKAAGPAAGVDVDHAALFRRLPTSYLVLHPDLTIADANETYLAAVGRRLADIVGQPVFEAFPASPDTLDEEGVPRIKRSFERARDTQTTDVMPLQKYDVPDEANGGFMERYWSLIHVPVVGPDGTTRYLLQRAEDVTDYLREREARRNESERGEVLRLRVEEVEADLFRRAQELAAALEAKDQASRRLAGLAEAALLLAGASSVEDLTESVIGAGLAALGADGGGIGVRDDTTGVLRITITPSLGAHTQVQYGEVPLDGPLPASVAARTGQTVVLPTVAAQLAWSAEMGPVYEATGRAVWASLPLQVGDRLLGSLTASWTEERTFREDEVELLSAFAAQCAQALDRLQVREAEQRAAAVARRMSETLQRSLLTEPPEPDHLQIAVRYQPAAREAQVGGDWYDAFLLPDGTTTLVVGDVTGHDRNAAAAMGQIRNVLRGVAQIVLEPSGVVLSSLDRALHNLAVDALATAVLVQVRQDEEEAAQGLRRVVWSNAGHPPPLLLRPDGTAELLQRPPDLLLGLQPDSERATHELVLEPGHTLLLYTDGLVERRGEPLDAGLERLRAAAQAHAGLTAEDLLDALLAELDDDPEDDVALLALRLFPEDHPRPAEAGPGRVPEPPLDVV